MLKLTYCIALLIVLSNNYALADVTQPCDNYVKCLEKLEEKQRECHEAFTLRLREKNLDESETGSNCSKKHLHNLHLEQTSLLLRKTENIRDCITENMESAEEIGTPEAQKKCQHQFDKLIQTLNSKSKRSKKIRGGKKQRKLSQKKEETRCKKERKVLHKKCSKIAKCCNLVSKCYDKAASILSQISDLKATLKSNRFQCRAKN